MEPTFEERPLARLLYRICREEFCFYGDWWRIVWFDGGGRRN